MEDTFPPPMLFGGTGLLVPQGLFPLPGFTTIALELVNTFVTQKVIGAAGSGLLLRGVGFSTLIT